MRLELLLAMVENLPNPVLIKDDQLRYVWVNPAFEQLFGKPASELLGNVDKHVFTDRQVAQCNGGDLRVLETGEVDHADEIVVGHDGGERDIITRKSRIILPDGETFLVGILHDVTEVSTLNRDLEASRASLAELSRTDPLTGIFNRRGLVEAVSSIADDSASVILFDIDHFKQVNDRFGHDIGDEALLHVASIVGSHLGPGQHFARLGGEEFAIYQSGGSLEDALRLAESIRVSLENGPMTGDAEPIALTASFGVAHQAPGDLTLLLKAADQGMYAAKEAGRNQVVSVEPSLPTRA